jgi:hypothetical protein
LVGAEEEGAGFRSEALGRGTNGNGTGGSEVETGARPRAERACLRFSATAAAAVFVAAARGAARLLAVLRLQFGICTRFFSSLSLSVFRWVVLDLLACLPACALVADVVWRSVSVNNGS